MVPPASSLRCGCLRMWSGNSARSRLFVTGSWFGGFKPGENIFIHPNGMPFVHWKRRTRLIPKFSGRSASSVVRARDLCIRKSSHKHEIRRNAGQSQIGLSLFHLDCSGKMMGWQIKSFRIDLPCRQHLNKCANIAGTQDNGSPPFRRFLIYGDPKDPHSNSAIIYYDSGEYKAMDAA